MGTLCGNGDILSVIEKGTATVFAVVKRHRTHPQQWADALELIGGVRTGGGIAFDPLVRAWAETNSLRVPARPPACYSHGRS
jgi:hypothetical protein